MGPLTEPKLPEVPGIERFEGKMMHSSRWDHDYDLAGKRVASIGTGASAIQYVPAIQAQVEQLYVFQRSRRGSCRTAPGRSALVSGRCFAGSRGAEAGPRGGVPQQGAARARLRQASRG